MKKLILVFFMVFGLAVSVASAECKYIATDGEIYIYKDKVSAKQMMDRYEKEYQRLKKEVKEQGYEKKYPNKFLAAIEFLRNSGDECLFSAMEKAVSKENNDKYYFNGATSGNPNFRTAFEIEFEELEKSRMIREQESHSGGIWRGE